MGLQAKNLYESATGKLRVQRRPGLVVLVIDGQGLAIAPADDFAAIEKWAKSRGPGPNATIDSTKIMDKLEVLICRPGTTFASTRGSIKPLEKLVKGIKAAGWDTKEFQLPPELKDGYVSPEEREKERRKKEAEEAEKNQQDITAG